MKTAKKARAAGRAVLKMAAALCAAACCIGPLPSARAAFGDVILTRFDAPDAEASVGELVPFDVSDENKYHADREGMIFSTGIGETISVKTSAAVPSTWKLDCPQGLFNVARSGKNTAKWGDASGYVESIGKNALWCEEPGNYTAVYHGYREIGGSLKEIVSVSKKITVTKSDDGGGVTTDPKQLIADINEMYGTDDEMFWQQLKERFGDEEKVKNGKKALDYMFGSMSQIQQQYSYSAADASMKFEEAAAAAQQLYDKKIPSGDANYPMVPSVVLAQGTQESSLTDGESRWSNVLKTNNNPYGLTGKQPYSSKEGTARPKNEGGRYAYYNSVTDATISHNMWYYRWYKKLGLKSSNLLGSTKDQLLNSADFEKVIKTYCPTNPNYVHQLKSIIASRHLDQYDQKNADGTWKTDMAAKLKSTDGRINRALQWWKATADDNTHGYSQSTRSGPSYDCSSFVYYGLKNAGFSVGGLWSTSTMRGQMASSGEFTDSEFKASDWKSLKPGDILWRDGHTEAVWAVDTSASDIKGGVKTIGAHSARGTKNTADDSGNEISVVKCSGKYTRVIRAKQ